MQEPFGDLGTGTRYQHWHFKIFIFPLQFLFGKKGTYMSNTPQYFFLCFTWNQYYFAAIKFSIIHPEASISVLEKRLFEFLELPVH